MNNVELCIQSIILFICRAVLFIIMVFMLEELMIT